MNEYGTDIRCEKCGLLLRREGDDAVAHPDLSCEDAASWRDQLARLARRQSLIAKILLRLTQHAGDVWATGAIAEEWEGEL